MPTSDPTLNTILAIIGAIPVLFTILGMVLKIAPDDSKWSDLRDAFMALGFDGVKLFRALKSFFAKDPPPPPAGRGDGGAMGIGRKVAGLSVFVLALSATGCGLTLAEIKKDITLGLDLSQAACVLATEFVTAEEVALACSIDRALVTAVETLLKSKAMGHAVAVKASAKAYSK